MRGTDCDGERKRSVLEKGYLPLTKIVRAAKAVERRPSGRSEVAIWVSGIVCGVCDEVLCCEKNDCCSSVLWYNVCCCAKR